MIREKNNTYCVSKKQNEKLQLNLENTATVI